MRQLRHDYRHVLRRYSSKSTEAWNKPTGKDTGIMVYNCVARRKVPLIMSNSNYLSWYTCGPTVYDSAHIGHASCYVKFDIIQRILKRHFNLNLVTAMNITDIDDKIIARAQQENTSYVSIARRYESEFWTDMRSLNVCVPNVVVRVSEHIKNIVEFIERIQAKQLAYAAQDGSVYFNVQKFPHYGKLQTVNISEEANNSTVKLSAADFALWKSNKSEIEPYFEAPWGRGRPGWHIECSALASMIFGSRLDVHAGGLDLRFPHHENEEAQSCVHHDCNQWVNYWLHAGHLSLREQAQVKMSKSLKNTVSIAQMLSQYTADEFRMACLLSNYKNTMEYGSELMELAVHTLGKFQAFRSDCQAYLSGLKSPGHIDSDAVLRKLSEARCQLDAVLRDDFNTARATTLLLEQVSHISLCINTHSTQVTEQTASCLDTVAAVQNWVEDVLHTFGFQFATTSALQQSGSGQNIDVSSLLDDLLKSRLNIRQRAFASKNKDLFQICDELRKCLQQHGIEVKDHNQGSTWSFINKTR